MTTPSQNRPQIDLIPRHGAIAAHRSTSLDLLIRITPPTPSAQVQRAPLNLGLVIDCSGSMQGAKLDYAKRAASLAVENLLPCDRLSVTTFDSHVTTLVPSTLATDKQAVLAKIRQIRAGSATALHRGWLEGAVQVSEYLHPDHLNRVLVLSDGLANEGETCTDVIASDVHGLAQRGVSTTTLGVGDDYSEDLLEAMARSGDGNFYHIDSAEQLPAIFETELLGLCATLGQKVSLGLTTHAGVQIKDLLNDFDLTSTGRYKLPNLVVGAPIHVVARLHIPALTTPTDLCTVRLAWNAPQQRRRQTQTATLHLPLVSAEQMSDFPAVGAVEEQVALLMAARARQEAIHSVDGGNVPRAMASLRQMRDDLAGLPASPLLAAEIEALADLESDFAAGHLAQARKKSRAQRYNLQRSRPR